MNNSKMEHYPIGDQLEVCIKHAWYCDTDTIAAIIGMPEKDVRAWLKLCRLPDDEHYNFDMVDQLVTKGERLYPPSSWHHRAYAARKALIAGKHQDRYLGEIPDIYSLEVAIELLAKCHLSQSEAATQTGVPYQALFFLTLLHRNNM